jgi:hypothetical protein
MEKDTGDKEKKAAHLHASAEEFVATVIDERDAAAVTCMPLERIDEASFSPVFSSRESLLLVCRMLHLQFNSLRQARYSSDALLWFLKHTRVDAALRKCNVCLLPIASRLRYSCRICAEFDLCTVCYLSKKHEHEHSAFSAIFVRGTSASTHENQSQIDTFDRQQHVALQRHNQELDLMAAVLPHAHACREIVCVRPMCDTVRNAKSTERNILVALHARSCTAQHSSCVVVGCSDVKRELRAYGSVSAHKNARLRASVKSDVSDSSALTRVPVATTQPSAAPAQSMTFRSINLHALEHLSEADHVAINAMTTNARARTNDLVDKLTRLYGETAAALTRRNIEERVRTKTLNTIRQVSSLSATQPIPWDSHREMHVVVETFKMLRELVGSSSSSSSSSSLPLGSTSSLGSLASFASFASFASSHSSSSPASSPAPLPPATHLVQHVETHLETLRETLREEPSGGPVAKTKAVSETESVAESVVGL